MLREDIALGPLRGGSAFFDVGAAARSAASGVSSETRDRGQRQGGTVPLVRLEFWWRDEASLRLPGRG